MITINLPNYILENPTLYKIENDDKFIVSKSSILKNERQYLRNSTHILILLINGSKILHLDDKELEINTNDILYLSLIK